jgi:hypothetical protein
VKRIALATALTSACCLAATASLSADAASTNAPPCTPKITTIQGHRAAVNCGPATATLRIGGRTYTFRNGFCEQSKSSGAAPELNLGTTVLGVKGNAGKPELSMLIDARLHSKFGTGSVFGADYGGRSLLAGESLIKASGNLPSSGTFTSTVAFGGKFTGSWNCHGVVVKTP